MITPIRPLLLRLFHHHHRHAQSPSARESQLLAENVRLSAELAAANARCADLERQADLAARQRNTAPTLRRVGW